MPTTLFRGGRIRADFDGVVHDSLLARDGRVIAIGTAADVRDRSESTRPSISAARGSCRDWSTPIRTLMHFGVAAAGLADLSDADDHDDIVASDHDGRVGAGTRRVGDGDAGR